jgi:hypothetical protein
VRDSSAPSGGGALRKSLTLVAEWTASSRRKRGAFSLQTLSDSLTAMRLCASYIEFNHYTHFFPDTRRTYAQNLCTPIRTMLSLVRRDCTLYPGIRLQFIPWHE